MPQHLGLVTVLFCLAAAFASAEAPATEAALRAASPWLPADSVVTKSASGSWSVRDNVQQPFVDDPEVLGVWNAVDFVESSDQFNPYAATWTSSPLFWTRLEFFPGGFQKSSFLGSANVSNRWSKGVYLNKASATAASYQVLTVADVTYLFVQWKSGDYSTRAEKPWYYVFRR
jgi:hypothetical protein